MGPDPQPCNADGSPGQESTERRAVLSLREGPLDIPCEKLWPLSPTCKTPLLTSPGYCGVMLVILTVRITVCLVTTLPEVPVPTTVTWTVDGAAFTAYPLIPHPDRPAARAQAPASSRQRCQRRCVL